MNLKELCPNIKERDIWLYGNQEEIIDFLNHYAEHLNVCGVVTEYADEVKIQPYEAWNIRTDFLENLTYSPNQLIVICYQNLFQTLRWRLLYLGRKEYIDFLSSNLIESLLYEKQLIVCMGTQLISQMCILLENSKEILEKYSIIYYAESNIMEAYKNHLQEYTHVARYCDVHICSDCEKERYELKKVGNGILSKNCKQITVADYGFFGYFPQIERNRDRISDYLLRGYERLNMSYETVAFAREDNEILKLCKSGASEDTIAETVGAEEFYSQQFVETHFAEEVERYKQLESKSDIKLGGFIEAHKGEYLCRNLNEWYEPVVSFVTDEILKRLGLPSLTMDKQDRKRLLEESCGSDILVYPSVKKALGIAGAQHMDRYRVVTYTDVKYMSWDEYLHYTVLYLQRAIGLMEFTGMDKTLKDAI